MTLANKVYVLVPTCVYDHGVAGVFYSYEDAERAAKELWDQTDGHHRFRIDEREIGKIYHTFEKDLYNELDKEGGGLAKKWRENIETREDFNIIVKDDEED